MRSDWSERKWIVNESALMELFSTCHTCGVPITDKKITSCGFLFKIIQSDSPGYNAKYTCYSFMDDATKKIIMSDLIQVKDNHYCPVTECL